MYDRDARLTQILRIGRDVSRRGEGISLLDAMKRARYVGYRPTFRPKDLVPIISADPSLVEDWLSYSEDKRTLGGWYILRSGEIGQVSRPVSGIKYRTIEEAVAEYVVRELDYWMEPDYFPPDWTKTLADLVAESKQTRSVIGPPETGWARAYERSLLRPWARFPLDGDVYEALEDTPIKFLTHWRAPFTGGGEGQQSFPSRKCRFRKLASSAGTTTSGSRSSRLRLTAIQIRSRSTGIRNYLSRQRCAIRHRARSS